MLRTASLFVSAAIGLAMLSGEANAQKGGKGGGGGGRGGSPGGAGAGGFKGGPGGFKGGASAKPVTPGIGGFKGSTTPVSPGSGAFKGGTTISNRFAPPTTGNKMAPAGGLANWQANTRNWQTFNHNQNQSRASLFFFPGFAGNYWYPYLFPYYSYYNYYNPYNYYGNGYPGGFSFGGSGGGGIPYDQGPAQEPTDYVAHIRVLLADPNAQVWFNGYKTSSTGSTRHFDTPALTPAFTYFYKVKATWSETNQPVTEERDIQVTAGMHAVVDFTRTPVREIIPSKK